MRQLTRFGLARSHSQQGVSDTHLCLQPLATGPVWTSLNLGTLPAQTGHKRVALQNRGERMSGEGEILDTNASAAFSRLAGSWGARNYTPLNEYSAIDSRNMIARH